MAVRIRLARHGKKNFAYFHVVVADSRSPRDGRFIEEIGFYNPNTNPATIEVDTEKALKWILNGAQPSETCRRILSYKGVLLKKHLQEGVRKGAISQEVADQRWNAWFDEKLSKVDRKKSDLAQDNRTSKKASVEAEAKVNETRAAEIAAKKAEEARLAAEALAAAKKAEEAEIAPEIPEVAVNHEANVAPEAPKAEESTEAEATQQ